MRTIFSPAWIEFSGVQTNSRLPRESGEEECDALRQRNIIYHSTAEAQKATTGLLETCHAQEGVIESFGV